MFVTFNRVAVRASPGAGQSGVDGVGTPNFRSSLIHCISGRSSNLPSSAMVPLTVSWNILGCCYGEIVGVLLIRLRGNNAVHFPSIDYLEAENTEMHNQGYYELAEHEFPISPITALNDSSHQANPGTKCPPHFVLAFLGQSS